MNLGVFGALVVAFAPLQPGNRTLLLIKSQTRKLPQYRVRQLVIHNIEQAKIINSQ